MMPSGYLLLITNIYVHLSSGRETCLGPRDNNSFPCKWTVQDYELDLTPFQLMGTNLTITDNNGNDFYFTPCNNLLPATSTTWLYMAVEVDNQANRNYLAQYNPSINPVIRFDEKEQPIWNFQYSENFSIEYICDYNLISPTFMEITEILEVYPDEFLMRISSHFLCDNVTIDELGKNQCIWNSSNGILDLRPLYGQEIGNNYYLWVCQNSNYATGGHCTSAGCCAMYVDESSTSSTRKYAYGIWDPFVQPSFANDEWKFEYRRSASGSTSTLTVYWVCDPSVNTYQVLSQTVSLMRISSVYACPAEHRCIFFDQDYEENVLDLSQLTGTLLKYANDNLTYSFEYTVCSNDILCNGSISTMAMRWNIAETKCDPYLAIWDGFDGYDLSYDDGLEQWKFTYFNGEMCENQKNTEFNIYWKCNQTVPNWEITDVESIDACHYAMYIDSFYSC